MKKELVFVYGTLKRHHGNNGLLPKNSFITSATTVDKYIMYSLGIPFVSKSNEMCKIHGEVYEVDKRTFNNLDMLEGHPNWYKREKINVYLLPNKKNIKQIKEVKAWLYFNEVIPSGAQLLEKGIY